MNELETYCLKLFFAIKNGLSLLLKFDFMYNVKTVNQTADGLEAVIEFEGKKYRIRITQNENEN